MSDREERKNAPREWDGDDVLALQTGRVLPPVELLDYVQRYLLLHPFCCRDKCILWYLLMCSVTNSVVIAYERLTNGALMSSFIVSRAASWHIDTTSAPEHPSVCEEMSRVPGLYDMKTYQECNFRNVNHGVDAHLR